MAFFAFFVLTYFAEPYFRFGNGNYGVVNEDEIGNIILNTMIPIYAIAASHYFEWKFLDKKNIQQANPVIMFILAIILLLIIITLDVLVILVFGSSRWDRLNWAIWFSAPVGFLSDFPLWRGAIISLKARKEKKAQPEVK